MNKQETLAHYREQADQAVKRELTVEDPRFAITGSVMSQPWCGVRDEFSFTECGSLDAPNYVPAGSVELVLNSQNYAATSVRRPGTSS